MYELIFIIIFYIRTYFYYYILCKNSFSLLYFLHYSQLGPLFVFLLIGHTPPNIIYFILTDHRVNEETSTEISLTTAKRAKVFADYIAMQKQGLAEVGINFYVHVQVMLAILSTIFFVSTS